METYKVTYKVTGNVFEVDRERAEALYKESPADFKFEDNFFKTLSQEEEIPTPTIEDSIIVEEEPKKKGKKQG